MSEPRTEYQIPGKTEIRQGCLLPYSDPRYEPPNAEEIRAAIKHGNLTGAAAGELVGVNGRTVRKWTGAEREIPYSAWRLLLICVGLARENRHVLAAEPDS